MSRPTSDRVASWIGYARRGATAATQSMSSPILSHGAPIGVARTSTGTGGTCTRHRGGTAAVHEDTGVVDDRDARVDDVVAGAVEGEFERSDRAGVPVRDDVDRDAGVGERVATPAGPITTAPGFASRIRRTCSGVTWSGGRA